MKESFIEFNTAKLAKDKGFDWNTTDFYNIKGKLFSNGWCEDIFDTFQEHFELNNNALVNANLTHITAPTQSLLQKWLREKHNIHITMFSSSQESWMFRITKPHQKLEEGVYGEDFESYEEALEVGLQETLKLIK